MTIGQVYSMYLMVLEEYEIKPSTELLISLVNIYFQGKSNHG